MMKPSIQAIGTANPEHRFSQKEVVGFMASAHQLQGEALQRLVALYRATGIKYRYSVLSDYGAAPESYRFYTPGFDPFPSTKARNEKFREHALPLALSAIEDCLPPGFDRSAVTHLITVSCTGLYAPGLDIELVEALGLPLNIRRTAINFMGCYGVFSALRAAGDICKGTKTAKVLIVSVELCSLHFQKDPTPDYLLSNALFGDGAAAALVQNTNYGFQLDGDYCTLVPGGKSEMQWRLGDAGFEMALSDHIPELIETKVCQLIQSLLADSGLQREQISFYAIHPGGKRIISCIQRALGLENGDCSFAMNILSNFGNMSSASILFVLKEIWNNLNSGDRHKNVLCLAFGPGLTLESMILSINNRDDH